MLFSFALIATLLTFMNVGVNETGNSALSTATTAHAATSGPVINLTGGASSNAITTPTSACFGSCGPVTTTNPPPAGVAIMDPKKRGVFYGCASVSAAGICSVNGVVVFDTFVQEPYKQCQLEVGGSAVAIGGQSAVLYMRSRLGPIWNGAKVEERMYANLTGMELGWAPYPINWSAVNAQNYNGTQADVSEGPYRFRCVTKYRVVDTANTKKSVTCGKATDGRAFPYAVGYYASYTDYSNQKIYQGQKNKNWVLTAGTCAYQAPGQEPAKMASKLVTCYYNLSHSGWYSTNRAAIGAGGTRTSNPPTYLGTYPQKPYISGRNSTAQVNNCTTNLSLNASLNLSNGYAYYRLQGNATYQKYQYYIWDTAYTRGVQLPADIRPAGFGPISGVVYGTNVCRNGTPNTWQQYPTFGSLPAGVNFSYSSCKRNVTWTCKIPNPPRINGVANSVQVMRDGSYLPTNLGGVVISGSGVRDVAGGAVQDKNTSYMVNVVNGSSPFNGTNANDGKQYFELWKSDRKTETQWGTWISQPNANKNSYLTYYWSSDNGATWRMTYQAKINTAQFGVPWQATSTSGPSTMWKTENNVDCDGVKTSNAATVLRSVSSGG
jgi:hypothetical protein